MLLQSAALLQSVMVHPLVVSFTGILAIFMANAQLLFPMQRGRSQGCCSDHWYRAAYLRGLSAHRKIRPMLPKPCACSGQWLWQTDACVLDAIAALATRTWFLFGSDHRTTGTSEIPEFGGSGIWANMRPQKEKSLIQRDTLLWVDTSSK